MKKISILWATLVVFVLSQLVHMLDGFLGLKYYMDPQYFGVWSKIMMPVAGPPPASFFYYSIAFNIIVSLLFVVVYAVIKNGVPGKKLLGKGLMYGFLMFLIAGIPSALAMMLFFNLPVQLVFLWTAEDLIIKLVGGVIVAKFGE